MEYAERIKAQSNSTTWADQINNKSLPLLILSYATVKKETNDNSDLCLTNESTYVCYKKTTTSFKLHKA